MKFKQHISQTLLALFLMLSGSTFSTAQTDTRIWPAAQARQWYAEQPWILGCNFIPSTAVNQLEMWQETSFDTATINRELGWAAGTGFNTVRVYLHHIAWEQDSSGLLDRMDVFLALADSHGIRTIFVLFDDCWNEQAKPGIQPAPRPGVHNSGWLQCPSKETRQDSTRWPVLERYEKSILEKFNQDKRVLLWDLYNEPGNSGYDHDSYPLLRKIFQWAWDIRPAQPLTCGVWREMYPALNTMQLLASDVISFHHYGDSSSLRTLVDRLEGHNRPIVCTEYMARTNNSLFATHLPIFKEKQVGAINWGLVSGKTNTIYPWGSKEGAPEPAVWFHDIFRADGTPFDPDEIELIRELSGRQ